MGNGWMVLGWGVMGGLTLVGLCCRRKRQKATRAEKLFPVPRYVDPTVKKIVWETERLHILLGRPKVKAKPAIKTKSDQTSSSPEDEAKEEGERKDKAETQDEEASTKHQLSHTTSEHHKAPAPDTKAVPTPVTPLTPATPLVPVNPAVPVTPVVPAISTPAEDETVAVPFDPMVDEPKSAKSMTKTGDMDILQRLSPHDAEQYLNYVDGFPTDAAPS